MSEFFEPTPDVPDDEGMDEEMPPWLHPPASAVPGLMADRRILARAGPVAILLSHVDAYPVGCNLVLRIIGRRPQGMDHRTWLELHESLMGAGFHRTPDASGGEPLRFGLRFADGTKVVADRGFYDHGAAPDTPVLIHQENGGGGGGRNVVLDQALWAWPLLPPEPVESVFDWQAMDIELQSVVLDGAAVVAAADRSGELLP